MDPTPIPHRAGALRALREVLAAPRSDGSAGVARFWAALGRDFERNGGRLTPRSFARALVWPDRFGALAWIRVFALFERRGLPTAAAYRVLLHVHGLEIDRDVEIGPGLFLPHPRGVLFATGTRIGASCAIYGAVRFLANERGVPVVEDDVLLGDGARLLGPVRVRRGARVGAGAVVTRDVPEGATVAGVPARVVAGRPS